MKSEFLENVATELKVSRFRSKLTFEDIKNKLGIAPSTMVRYESGKYDIKLGTLNELLNLYEIEPIIFFENIVAKKQ